MFTLLLEKKIKLIWVNLFIEEIKDFHWNKRMEGERNQIYLATMPVAELTYIVKWDKKISQTWLKKMIKLFNEEKNCIWFNV